jgi:hypothetical protein
VLKYLDIWEEGGFPGIQHSEVVVDRAGSVARGVVGGQKEAHRYRGLETVEPGQMYLAGDCAVKRLRGGVAPRGL